MEYFWLTFTMVVMLCIATGFSTYWIAVDKTERQWQERYAVERRRRMAAENRSSRMGAA